MNDQPATISAEHREQLGTRAARRLRRDGRLPANVYGHGEANLSVTLPMKQALETFRGGGHVFNLDFVGGGNPEQVLVKDVQYDHLGVEVLHVDLFRVRLDEEVTTEVPVVLVGTPKGAAENGILTQMRDVLELVSKVRDIPDEVRIDVADLDVGDSIHVSDVTLPAGSSLPPGDSDFTIAMVAKKVIREADEEVEPISGDEPEIIGDKQTAVQPGEDAPADPNA